MRLILLTLLVTISNSIFAYSFYDLNKVQTSAQNEFNTINANLLMDDLVINEFMASNEMTMADQDGEFDDWIEIYNNGDASINITGYSLSDDENELALFTFPEGSVIGADEYLIIWADDDLDQAGFHAAFKLGASGETIFLSDAAGMIIDEVTYPQQTTDISYGRIPNGTGDFAATAPTFNSTNDVETDCTGSGGDADGDGICADMDCDDNDANIGFQQNSGVSCDDNNADTTNDIIQSDGCTCSGVVVISSDLVINEFMASNEVTVTDQDGEFEDWIELYNNGNASIDLSGYALTDDGTNLQQFIFPDGTTIGAAGYLVIWADGDLDQSGLHADFKLSGSGESIYLIDSDGNVIDLITYTDQEDDVSFGRFPNGTGDFQTMMPTFNADNGIMTNTLDNSNIENISVFPNPTSNLINIESSIDISQISLFNLSGQNILHNNVNANNHKLSTTTLLDGIYVLQVTTKEQDVAQYKIIVQH